MKAVFIELPAFARVRDEYLDDEAFSELQRALSENPDAGEVVPGTGGLRKMRYGDERRGKGKRGGLRVIYFWKFSDEQFWLFSVYDKDEMTDLTPKQRQLFKQQLQLEIEARSGAK